MIKKLLTILLFMIMLFAFRMNAEAEEEHFPASPQTELRTTDFSQHHDSGIDLSSRTNYLSDRNKQTFIKTHRFLHVLILKEQKALHKTSEHLLTTNSLNLSSLRIRSGHWAYVLRKIII